MIKPSAMPCPLAERTDLIDLVEKITDILSDGPIEKISETLAKKENEEVRETPEIGQKEETTLSREKQSSLAVIHLQELAGANSSVIVRPSAKSTRDLKKKGPSNTLSDSLQISLTLKNYRILKK